MRDLVAERLFQIPVAARRQVTNRRCRSRRQRVLKCVVMYVQTEERLAYERGRTPTMGVLEATSQARSPVTLQELQAEPNLV